MGAEMPKGAVEVRENGVRQHLSSRLGRHLHPPHVHGVLRLPQTLCYPLLREDVVAEVMVGEMTATHETSFEIADALALQTNAEGLESELALCGIQSRGERGDHGVTVGQVSLEALDQVRRSSNIVG